MTRTRGVDPELEGAWVRGQCRWCLGPVPPPKRTFCGSACVYEWRLRSNPGFRRDQVFARDGGVCRACGRDCHVLLRDLRLMLHTHSSALDARLALLGLTRRSCGPLDARLPIPELGRVGRVLEPSKKVWDPSRTLWEADHILPVVQGGGSCGLANLQTLCMWCHKEKTAKLAQERARKATCPPSYAVCLPDDVFDTTIEPV